LAGHVSVWALEDVPKLTADRVAEAAAAVLADGASADVELDSMAAELLERYEEVNLLYDLTSALMAVLDVPRLCEIALENALRAAGADRALIGVSEATGPRLRVAATQGFDVVTGTDIEADDTITARVAATGRQLVLLAGEPVAGPSVIGPVGADPVLSVPLVAGGAGGTGNAIGAMTLVGKRSGDRFTSGDAKLASAIGAQLAVAIANSRLVDSVRTSERVAQEIEIAAGIQRRLLPEKPPQIAGVNLAGRCTPATTVGGDYFDFLVDAAGHLWVIIADVAGHSIGSGLLMAMCRSILRREIGEGRSPSMVLGATNDAMLEDLVRAGLFITVFCARFDPATGRFDYANGAHNPPLLCRDGAGRIEELDADGMALGMLEDVVYEEGRIDLGAGDLVVLYTDGVTEARTDDGDQFGEPRLHALVAAAGDVGPDEVLDQIEDAVVRHTLDAPPQDDVTVVALKTG